MKTKPFTLLELLIVVAIIGLLAGMLMPAFVKSREVAKSSVCKNNLRNLGIAFNLYVQESKDIMPFAALMPSLNLNSDPPITEVLAPHLQGDKKVFACPSDITKNYFASEGASYEYNAMLGGRKISLRTAGTKTMILHDYEPFHGPANTPGAENYLFGDGHVGDLN
ncbi:MAG: hypothetical protein A2X49_05335 [Lentisphaerae bacterium GWF2_52_8]|nr:MAG: hypothetical protein A2X49_05335 [Lentisphaerae bacterium GWF2_52_8]